MSFVFSKNKEKRSRSATGESNSSFVKNVTLRVSGLLPAGITKWFSSPSSSSANGSAVVADGTDSSTEDEAPESSSVIQPPAKRIRYSSPLGSCSQLTTSETTATGNVIEPNSVLYSSIQSPHGCQNWREPNFVSTPIRVDDIMNTNNMSINTMGDRSEIDNSFMHHTVSAIGQSITLKRKSLFDCQKQKEQSWNACAQTAAHQVKDLKQPYFKPHLLGSPFYPGRTMYGGSSASSTYMSQPNIRHSKMAYVNESEDTESVMSTSSRRVMDLLENYSSPLIEAKRIPRYELSELRDINRGWMPSTSTSNRHSYKTHELYVPTKASLIRMKARSRLMESTKAARQIIASHSSTHLPHKPYTIEAPNIDQPSSDSGPTKSKSKLKSRLTRPNRGVDALEMPENVELPTAVLQIDKNNLPKFSFGSTPPPIKQTNKPCAESFKFSTPLQATPDTKAVTSRASAFNFDSPEKSAENITPPKFSFMKQYALQANDVRPPLVEMDVPAKMESGKSVISFAKSNRDWKCSVCWVSNKAEAPKCACCEAKPPSKEPAAPSEVTSKCTSCKLANTQLNSTKCINCEKMHASIKPNNPLPALVSKSTNSSKWKCDGCWVDNEKSDEKCVCCGNRNPRGTTTSQAQGTATASSPVTILKQKDWRCEDCFITNKPTTEKCAACGGAKPGTKPAPKKLIAATNSKPDSKMAEIMNAQHSYWECTICLASNANDKVTCMCCDAPKDPQESEPTKFTNFKFNADSGFKFGIDPKVQETNLAKKVDETSKPEKPEESETNNNVVPTIKQSDTAVSTKAVEEPKPSFSFGIPQQKTQVVATGSASRPATDPATAPATAPAVVKLPDIVKPAEEKERLQEVPSISFTASEPTKPSTGLFTSHVPTANPQNAMNAFLNNSVETTQSISNKPSAISAAPTFSFSARPVKPSTDMFTPSVAPTALTNSLTTQVATGSSLAMEMFSKPEATAATATSFFTKPETTNAPASSLIQNNSATSTVAPPAATSLFSFGNNQSTAAAPTAPTAPAAPAAPATDVNKFTFTFGSSTTTPAFGATPQTSTTFSLPTGNQLSNGPTNPLGGSGGSTNHLSITGNPLGSTGGNSLMTSGNGMLGSGSTPMFDAPAKNNGSMWPTSTEQTNQNNPFMASTPAKPFSFGATPTQSPFGSQPVNAQQPAMFGGNTQPAQNIFGMNQSNGNQPSLFGGPAASQPAPMFGAHASTPAPALGMFGASSASPFGAAGSSLPTFEAAAPAPAFNFGGQQASPIVFGFGQQPQQALCMPAEPSMQLMDQPQMQGMQQPAMQQQQPGMFFGANASPGPMHFTVGSAPTAGRRLRKAVRRTQQR